MDPLSGCQLRVVGGDDGIQALHLREVVAGLEVGDQVGGGGPAAGGDEVLWWDPDPSAGLLQGLSDRRTSTGGLWFVAVAGIDHAAGEAGEAAEESGVVAAPHQVDLR